MLTRCGVCLCVLCVVSSLLAWWGGEEKTAKAIGYPHHSPFDGAECTRWQGATRNHTHAMKHTIHTQLISTHTSGGVERMRWLDRGEEHPHRIALMTHVEVVGPVVAALEAEFGHSSTGQRGVQVR